MTWCKITWKVQGVLVERFKMFSAIRLYNLCDSHMSNMQKSSLTKDQEYTGFVLIHYQATIGVYISSEEDLFC